jgi:hypothetical protein
MNRGLLRVALVISVLLEAAFVLWLFTSTDDHGLTLMDHLTKDKDWAGVAPFIVWFVLLMKLALAFAVFLAVTWVTLWAVASVGRWVVRGFAKEAR